MVYLAPMGTPWKQTSQLAFTTVVDLIVSSSGSANLVKVLNRWKLVDYARKECSKCSKNIINRKGMNFYRGIDVKKNLNFFLSLRKSSLKIFLDFKMGFPYKS